MHLRSLVNKTGPNIQVIRDQKDEGEREHEVTRIYSLKLIEDINLQIQEAQQMPSHVNETIIYPDT